MRARRWMATAGLCAGLASPAGTLSPQSRQGLLSLPEGRLFYEVVGSGDPIFVVHGGPGLDHRYLRPGLDVLAASHALVYYDQRGTGRSDVPLNEATINLDAFVQDIEELRQALGYERITVLGHSFGGLVALAYTRAHPDAVQALVLMDTAEPGSRFAAATARRQAAARTAADSAEIAEAMASPGFAARDRGTMSRIYRAAYRGTLHVPDRVNELDLELSARTAKNGPEVARLLGTSMGKVDWWDSLGDVTVPVLVVHGRYEPAPLAMAKALAEAFPRGRFVPLDSGHFPYIEDPQGLAEAVSGFLAGPGGG